MRYLSAGFLAFATTVANAAFEFDIPSIRSGLWESKMVSEGKEEITRRCIEEPNNKLTGLFGKAMGEAGAQREICWRLSAQKLGNSYVVDSYCKYGNTLHTVISGDFDKAFTIKSISHVDAPGSPRDGQIDVVTIEERWIGVCTPDQKSGGAAPGASPKQ